MRGLTLRDVGFVGGLTPASSYDTDAQTYITAVEAADGQALETAVRDAINAFVVGCKTDGIWTAIKASCILAGARTLTGALVPLAGTAPTNSNFVSGDYDRKIGLKGNASNKYLNSNYAATLQNSVHMAAYTSEPGSVSNNGPTIIGTSLPSVAVRSILYQEAGVGSAYFCINSAIDTTYPGAVTYSNGFRGTTRSSSTNVSSRIIGTSYTKSISSNGLLTTNFYIFGENRGNTLAAVCNTRITFYSLGETLDLVKLESRANALIASISAAI